MRQARLRESCGRSRSRRLGAHGAAASGGSGLGARDWAAPLPQLASQAHSGRTLTSPGVPVAPPTWSLPSCSSLPAAGAAAPVTAGAAGGAEDAEAARGSEPGGGARRGRAPRSRERARERIRVLMLMPLPGTGRTAHALLWGGGQGKGGWRSSRVMQQPRQHQKGWWHLQRWGKGRPSVGY